MNHGEFFIERAGKGGDGENGEKAGKNEGVFYLEFGFSVENEISGGIENCQSHYDVDDAKDSVGTKAELVIVKVNNGPSVYIGDATVKLERLDCVG